MIHRRTFLCGLTLGALAVPLPAEGQPAGKLPKIGVLHPGSGTQPLFAALAEIG